MIGENDIIQQIRIIKGFMMKTELFIEATTKFLLGVVLVGSSIFLSRNFLIFLRLVVYGRFICADVPYGNDHDVQNPELLKTTRCERKTEGTKPVVKLSGLMCLAGLSLRDLVIVSGYIAQRCCTGASAVFLIAYLFMQRFLGK